MNQWFIRFLFLLGAFSITASPEGWSMAKRPPAPEAETLSARELPPPLTLKEAFMLALTRSETLAMKQADIEETWGDFLLATGEAAGDFSFQIDQFRQEPQGGGTADGGSTATSLRSTRRTRRFVYSQPLFSGFRSLGALTGAGSLRRERMHTLRRAEELLFLDVALSFYNVLRLQKDLEITHEILALFDDRVDELSERVKIGRSREGEVATALARKRTLEAEIAQTRGDLASEQRVLEFLSGLSLDDRGLLDEIADPGSPEPLENYLPSALERSDVLSAEEAKRTANSGLIIAQSKLWPEISIDTNLYEKREGFQSGIDWDLLLNINIPIARGGEAIGEIKKALSERKRARLTLTESRRRAELEIKQAYDAWNSSLEEIQALKAAVDASQKNYELQKEDYTRNLVNNLDVLQALEFLNDARIEADRAYFENKINYWRLRIATGSCCESDGIID